MIAVSQGLVACVGEVHSYAPMTGGSDCGKRLSSDQSGDSITSMNLKNCEALLAQFPGIYFQFSINSMSRESELHFISNTVTQELGVPASAGRYLYRLIHPDDQIPFVDCVMLAANQDRDFHFEGRFVRFDGEVRWIRVTGKYNGCNGENKIFNGNIRSLNVVISGSNWTSRLKMRLLSFE